MSTDPPRLFVSDLTGRVYFVTSYQLTDDGNVIATDTKTDVTKDFEAIEAARAKHPPGEDAPG